MREDLKKLRKKAREFKQKNHQPEKERKKGEPKKAATDNACRPATHSTINQKILNDIPTSITSYSLRKGVKKGEDFSHLPMERSAQLAYACSLKPKPST